MNNGYALNANDWLNIFYGADKSNILLLCKVMLFLVDNNYVCTSVCMYEILLPHAQVSGDSKL